MRLLPFLAAVLTLRHVQASESVFNVHDDVLAFPQYDISFSETYITLEKAREKLRGSDPNKNPISSWDGDLEGQLARFHAQDDTATKNDGDELDEHGYISMNLHSSSYICAIPKVKETLQNTTAKKQDEQPETDLATAANRGWRLLEDMEGKPCLYFSTGWWSYSFCYNGAVSQFHALTPGVNGARIWPPTEDPSVPTYTLGKYERKTVDATASSQDPSPTQHAGELQTKAETSYLVQRLGGGTTCDLTGKPRKVEVQFHCHPQSTDRIGWIKETSTCAYMMVIYTPRLCNDVAFLPPKATHVHRITCQQVLRPDEVAEWEARKSDEATRKMIGQGKADKPKVMVGKIEVGGQKLVGGEGKKIERGRVVLTTEERAEIVMMQKDGQIQGLTKEELEKLDLNPEAIATFQKELQKLAGKKDWKIVRIDEPNGQIQLRGIVGSNAGKKLSGKEKTDDPPPNQDGNEGSEEEYYLEEI